MRSLSWTPAFFLLIFLPRLEGVGRSNAGTEFIVGFMDNDVSFQVGLEIFVTTLANNGADVTVTTPLYDSGFSATTSVARQEVELLLVNYQLRCKGTGIDNKGVRIVSTEDITVYCVNKEEYTTDAYTALPVNVVGQEYYSIGYIANSQILMIGVHDATTVTVKLSDNSRSGSASSVSSVSISYGGSNYGNGQSFSATFDRYETFFVTQWVDYSSDLTGSYITSNKVVSCISGNYRSWIPTGTHSSDHLTEMLTSVDTWGTEFVTTSTPDRSIGDIFRVVASESNTNVNFGDGTHTFTLSQPGDFQELDIATGSYMTVVADKPVQIAMMAKTWQNDGPHYGDPAMSLVIPTVQYAAEYSWSTTNLPNGQPFNDKVSIIIDGSEKSGLSLDGAAITSSWSSVIGSNTWKQTWVRVNPGSHNLYHSDPTVTFLAMATGTEEYNSYAFMAGTRMAQINTVCVPTSTVEGDTVDNDCDGTVDEEANNGIDDDGDGAIDEDLALPPRVDGGWGSWSSWGSCSVTCGGSGTMTKTRNCDSPAPQNNGLDCVGSGSDSTSCTSATPCPIDGGWTNWSGWSSCPVTCGSGTQINTRSCTQPSPAHNGADCVGDEDQSKTCNTGVSCAVHGEWGSWSGWGACSVTCNSGTKTRSRLCDQPAPSNGGDDCPGDELDTTSCTMVPCPIDGEWGSWSGWGACSVTCASGTKTRSRLCDQPAPSHGGDDCSGDELDTTSCTMVPCPIDGGWGTWDAWSACSLTCGGIGFVERSRPCDRPSPAHLGADCPGSDYDNTTCDMSNSLCPSGLIWEQLFFTTTAGAPVDGGFGPWSGWGECTVSCGGGIRLRQRQCDDPVPVGAGQMCSGLFAEEEMCNTHACGALGYAHGVQHGGTCQGRRGLFDCKNGVQCIDILEKCNCQPNCLDWSDEDMEYAGCIMSLWECRNTAGHVVFSAWITAFFVAMATVITAW